MGRFIAELAQIVKQWEPSAPFLALNSQHEPPYEQRAKQDHRMVGF